MDSPTFSESLSGRIMAIDCGQRRIGIAVSDPLYITAQGLETILCKRDGSHFQLLAKLVKEKEVSCILVGMPYMLSGTEGKAAKWVREFTGKLKNVVNVPIEFIDERLSSIEAKKALTGMGYRTGHHKEKVDQTAAILMLQTYLDKISG